MSEIEYKAIVRQFLDQVFSKRNLDVLNEFVASSFVYHEPPNVECRGAEEYKQYFGAVLAAYPDLQMSVEHMIAEGETVAARTTFRGTHTGDSPAFGIPPTGKQVVVPMITYSTFAEGKLVEIWNLVDSLGMLQQLGVIPPLGDE